MAATTLVPILKAGAFGHEMQQFVDQVVRVAKGPTIDTTCATSGATVVTPLFNVFPGVTVIDFVIENTTAWSSGTTFQIGDSDAASRFLDSVAWSVAAGTKHINQ